MRAGVQRNGSPQRGSTSPRAQERDRPFLLVARAARNFLSKSLPSTTERHHEVVFHARSLRGDVVALVGRRPGLADGPPGRRMYDLLADLTARLDGWKRQLEAVKAREWNRSPPSSA